MATTTQIAHFWRRVDVVDGDACWNWKSSVDEKGYGNLRFGNVHTRAHKVAFEIANKKRVKKGFYVKHSCKNVLCCNPKHLYLSKGGNEADVWSFEFWKRIKVCGIDQCWPWIGKSKHRWGYGLCREKWTPEKGRGRMRGTHILAYISARGETHGLQVLHHCDNPPCCNPLHLFLGTQLENIHDMIRKKRDVRRKGDEKSNAKMNRSLVKLVRRIYKPYHRQFSARALARKYGISESNMLNIIKGKAWKHIHY